MYIFSKVLYFLLVALLVHRTPLSPSFPLISPLLQSSPPPTFILHTQKTLLASGITRDDLFWIACLSPRATLSPLIVCSTLIPSKLSWRPAFVCKVTKLRLYFRPEITLFVLTQNLGCPKFSSWGGNVTFTRRTFCKKPEGAISFTFGVRPQPVGFPGSASGF